MKIDINQVATISLQELHDILGNGDLGITDPETGQTLLPSKFEIEMEYEQAPTVQTAEAVNVIMTRLNLMRNELATLDSLFHDEFDGSYC